MERREILLSVLATASGVSLDAQVEALHRDEQSTVMVEYAEVPLYPAIARAAHQSGDVRIRVTVKNGIVVAAEAGSTPVPILANAARENVKTWRFSPNDSDSFWVTYSYRLSNLESGVPLSPHVDMQLPGRVTITAIPVKPATLY